MHYSAGVAYLLRLACIFGFCGIRCFYAGKPITGFLWLFTLGLLGFGHLLELILIPGMIAQDVCSLPLSEDANSYDARGEVLRCLCP
jgi:TM2 domain-containing membrane protein YozV